MESYGSTLYTIGNTPCVELTRFSRTLGFKSRIFAKLEYFNPTGSVTDRAALYMINDAVKQGLVKGGSLLIEATSGNMGVSVAYIAKLMGFKCLIVAPDDILPYNADLIASLGAKLVLTDSKKGMSAAIIYADNLWRETTGSYMLRQFTNEAAINAYHDSLGPELQTAVGDDIDYLVCGVGSGATISGTSQFLKKWNPNLSVTAVEPKESAVLSGKYPAPHGIRGIGMGFMPENYNPYIVERIIPVSTGDATHTASLAWTSDGIASGFSGGAALYAAVQLALETPDEARKIAVVVPDAAWRYKGSELFINAVK